MQNLPLHPITDSHAQFGDLQEDIICPLNFNTQTDKFSGKKFPDFSTFFPLNFQAKLPQLFERNFPSFSGKTSHDFQAFSSEIFKLFLSGVLRIFSMKTAGIPIEFSRHLFNHHP